MSLLLLSHIVCALVSVIGSTVMAVRPLKRGLRIMWSLTAYTLASGTWLVISLHQALAPACVAGITYLAVVSAGLWRAQYVLQTRAD